MKAPLLQGGSQIAQKGHNRLPGQNEGGWAPRPCPECRGGKLFEPKVANQLFCCPQHNVAWNNRATARGRVLTPFALVARMTRNGSSGKPAAREAGRKASAIQDRLIARYRDEDRKAGRMAWPEYIDRRLRLGLEPE